MSYGFYGRRGPRRHSFKRASRPTFRRSFKGSLRRTRTRRKRLYKRGYTRTSGFYGRFSGNHPELKFHDISVDDTLVAIGATIDFPSINTIAQGTTESERVGRKCVIRKIAWRYNIILRPTASDFNTSDEIRVILFLDKQCNGAPAINLDILETSDYQSFRNLANSGRFRVLMDRSYSLVSKSGTSLGVNAYGEDQLNDSFYKDCQIPLEFDGPTGVITEIKSNNIGVMLASASGNVGFFSKLRIRFSDT